METATQARLRTIPAAVASGGSGARAKLLEIGARAELIVSGMPQPPLGKSYQVWLARPGQAAQPTDALFSVNENGSGSIDVPGHLHGTEHVIVTIEPLGGSRHHTTDHHRHSLTPTPPQATRAFGVSLAEPRAARTSEARPDLAPPLRSVGRSESCGSDEERESVRRSLMAARRASTSATCRHRRTRRQPNPPRRAFAVSVIMSVSR